MGGNGGSSNGQSSGGSPRPGVSGWGPFSNMNSRQLSNTFTHYMKGFSDFAQQHTSPLQNTLRNQSEQLSDRIDSHVQRTSEHAVNQGRDRLKLERRPEDSWLLGLKKRGFNKGVDIVSDNLEYMANVAGGFAKGVGGRVIPETSDRLNPMHLLTAIRNPRSVSRQLQQRKEQLIAPYRFYQNPGSFVEQRWDQMKGSLHTGYDHFSDMDSGLTEKVKHGGRALVSSVQDTMGSAVGVGAGVLAIYGTGKRRVRTNQAMDSLFPKDKLYGKMARFPLTKFMFTKHVARIKGSPLLSAGLLAYGVGTSIGRHIDAKNKLETERPAIFKRLKNAGREEYASKRHMDLVETIRRTKTPEN